MTEKALTILQIIPELGAGGAEQGTIDVAAGIVAAGGRALVASHGGTRVHELARVGADHIDLPVHSKNPMTMWKNVARLKEVIIGNNVSLVHARSRAPAWSAWKACKDLGIPFVTTCHAPYNTGGKAKNFYNSSIAKADHIIAISDHVARYLRNHYHVNPNKITLIHRGISIDRFHPTAVTPHRLIQLSEQWRIPEGANIIMLPGRLTRWKGHHVLIDAMHQLQRHDLFAVIIGSDQGRSEYRKELEDSIQDKGLGGFIRIVDHCDDMPAAYMMSSMVVSASTDPEGFGRIPVEAQAMGRPIIATDHGGAQETIVRGQTGWLVPPNDASALTRAIEEVMDLNAHQRAVLATRSMAHIAQNFTKERMVAQTLDVYTKMLRISFPVADSEQTIQPGLHQGTQPPASQHNARASS